MPEKTIAPASSVLRKGAMCSNSRTFECSAFGFRPSYSPAVRLARANVCRHGLGDRVSVVHGDLLDGSPVGLDLVVANLPYVALGLQADRPELAEEPPEAVFAAGDGLGPYRRLVQVCESALQPDGFLAIQFHGQVVGTHASELSALTLAA